MIITLREQRPTIGDDLESARRFLVLARLLKQRAQAAKEMCNLGILPEENWYFYIEQDSKAQSLRLLARERLVSAEITAGLDFLEREVTLGAKDLEGSKFKRWPAYDQCFSLHPSRVDRWSR